MAVRVTVDEVDTDHLLDTYRPLRAGQSVATAIVERNFELQAEGGEDVEDGEDGEDQAAGNNHPKPDLEEPVAKAPASSRNRPRRDLPSPTS
jgi:hypothetical protein